MLWDFTCPDTLAPSHLPQTMFQAGGAASAGESHKRTMYSSLEFSHVFMPVAVETLGPCGPGAANLFAAIGRRLIEASQDFRSGYFFRQPIDVAVQRGNALSVMGTFPRNVMSADLSFLG